MHHPAQAPAAVPLGLQAQQEGPLAEIPEGGRLTAWLAMLAQGGDVLVHAHRPVIGVSGDGEHKVNLAIFAPVRAPLPQSPAGGRSLELLIAWRAHLMLPPKGLHNGGGASLCGFQEYNLVLIVYEDEVVATSPGRERRRARSQRKSAVVLLQRILEPHSGSLGPGIEPQVGVEDALLLHAAC
eukprot:CAMPEP_0177591086 /NCGR_PEP_ID=MMETSP0419_2-20121207/7788_1 /TAXON_ID=582737 /ORGANISM="Tetraselmis sp., Strain GSL018" /LENGTH=182 /DNA_ID=CAMNT_0019081761 /DNA_START=406 /DNA_END=953 /DNA_ORIENTATION=-